MCFNYFKFTYLLAAMVLVLRLSFGGRFKMNLNNLIFPYFFKQFWVVLCGFNNKSTVGYKLQAFIYKSRRVLT